jgi:hypothetical protein
MLPLVGAVRYPCAINSGAAECITGQSRRTHKCVRALRARASCAPLISDVNPLATSVTPAIRTVRFSQQFLAAALKVQRPAETEREALRQRPSLVSYYLLGHAIELALKSYLFARGLSLDDLRSRKYGHKLDVLLTECRRRRLWASCEALCQGCSDHTRSQRDVFGKGTGVPISGEPCVASVCRSRYPGAETDGRSASLCGQTGLTGPSTRTPTGVRACGAPIPCAPVTSDVIRHDVARVDGESEC